MIPRSGDQYFDIALAHTLAKLADTFEVLPGFAYYDDFQSSNAYATSRTRLNRADGTVLMGINFLRRLRGGLESPEVAVAAVCAHEFGHILQFRHRLFERVEAGRKTGKRGELQADYFAGYFVGLRKRERPNYPAAVFAMTQFSVGDYDIHSKQHHGTPKERGEAVVRGFEASFRDNKTISEAIEESSAYVLGIFSH